MAILVSLILVLCAVSTRPTGSCDQGRLILVISQNATAEQATSQLVEYISDESVSRGECLVIDEELNEISSQSCPGADAGSVDLGFCNAVFANFSDTSYTVKTQCVDASPSPGDTFNDTDELCLVVANVTQYLDYFKSILDRTLVEVYLKSCQNKTVCLAAYMEWLCSTQLPLFQQLSDDPTDGCGISDSNVQGTDGHCYARYKPCLGVCHRVLQRCPYYLPSKYQSDMYPDEEFVFGGYSAFACPTANQMINNRSSYSGTECLGGLSGADAVVHRPTTFTRMWTLSTLLLAHALLWQHL